MTQNKSGIRVAMEIQFQLNIPGPLPTTGNYEGAPVSRLYKPSKKYIKQAEKKVPKDFGYVSRKDKADFDRRVKESNKKNR